MSDERAGSGAQETRAAGSEAGETPKRRQKPKGVESLARALRYAVLTCIVTLGLIILGLRYLFSADSFAGTKERSELGHNIAVAVGLLAAGAWAVFQFVIHRAGETKLSMSLKIQDERISKDRRLVFFDVGLRNLGTGELAARPHRFDRKDPCYDDKEEVVPYPVTLEIRRIVDDVEEKAADREIDWFGAKGCLEPPVVINLLKAYERDSNHEFWMEPGESYHLGALLPLKRGRYFAKLTFIGKGKTSDEFWTRQFFFRLPARAGTFSPKPLPTASSKAAASSSSRSAATGVPASGATAV